VKALLDIVGRQKRGEHVDVLPDRLLKRRDLSGR